MISAIKTKILNLAKSMLKEGMSLRKIALCFALGTVLGTFPILGATTLLCTAAALALRLNLPAIQVVNYMVYPLQIILIAPFYGFGSWLFGQQNRLSGGENLIYRLQNDFWKSMADIWDLTLYAVFTWMIISPFLVLLIYSISKPLIRSFAGSLRRLQSSR
jgi:uncharacterized protein (DUF2062 family)